MKMPYLFRLPAAALALTAFISPPVMADDKPAAAKDETQGQADIQAAKRAITPWVELLMQDAFAKSWETAGPIIKSANSQIEWESKMKLAFQKVGKCTSRTFDAAELRDQVPMPDGTNVKGTFVVAEYSTVYSNIGPSHEIVTFQKTSDGKWKAAGFYVRPDEKRTSPGLIDAKVDADAKVSTGDTKVDVVAPGAKKQPPADAESDKDADVIPEDKDNSPAGP